MIVLYTTHCPKCKVLTRKLNDKGISYEICEDTKIMEEKGFVSLPMLDIDGDIKDFSAAMKWVGEQSAN